MDVRVINNKENLGPWITFDNNKHIYDILPDKFILTDPDLKFNKNIPTNFIEILANLSDKYETSKIGLALDISDHEKFFITNARPGNLSIYEWENDTFKVFDKYLSKDKVFIDIGGWIATTSMYGSRKSKHIYVIEADECAFNDMANNLKANCENNYTLINKAIYNIDNSITQTGHKGVNSNKYYFVETITLETIIKNYDINVANISIIKVDIEGGEENILDELFDMRIKHEIPLYISFHYCWWSDKNLDRFSFLSEQNKKDIIANPFISIFF